MVIRKAKEVVGIEAKAEFYELNPEAKYLVVFDAPIPQESSRHIQEVFKKNLGIDVLVGDSAGNIRIFELK